jgi:hypothetical protein
MSDSFDGVHWGRFFACLKSLIDPDMKEPEDYSLREVCSEGRKESHCHRAWPVSRVADCHLYGHAKKSGLSSVVGSPAVGFVHTDGTACTCYVPALCWCALPESWHEGALGPQLPCRERGRGADATWWQNLRGHEGSRVPHVLPFFLENLGLGKITGRSEAREWQNVLELDSALFKLRSPKVALP